MAKRGRKATQQTTDSAAGKGDDEADIIQSFRQAIWDAAGKLTNDKEAEDKRAAGTSEVNDNLVWKYDKILTFRDFCASSEHMDFPPLSPRQIMVADYMFGDEPKKMFHNSRNIAALCWGKGAGKDTISVLMTCYIVYVLLCMKNPQQFLGLANHDSIDLINVAAAKEQAQQVFFQNIKTRVTHWAWLRGQWDIQISGRFFSSSQKEDLQEAENKVTITSDAIIFPNNIRAFSGSSEAETLEGKNILCFILDEVDAFKSDSQIRSAEKIYRTLRTSAVSRFGTKFKGFAISYPRSKDGFIMKMYESTKKFLNMYGDRAFTWEVKPRAMFMAQTFEFEGIQIPMDFYEEFRLDPIGAKRAYLCQPPTAETPFMEDWDGIEAAVPRDKTPLFEFRDIIEDGLFRKKMTKTPYMADRSVQYVLMADLGQIKDSASLTLMHRELDKIYVDFTTAWVPDKENGIKVDLVNMEEIILAIREYVSVDGFYADQWQSRLMIAKMRQLGVKSDIITLDFSDYKTFKTLLYSGNIKLIRHARLLDEIKNLQMYNGRKVDHAPNAHNDMAVTVVMGTKVLTTLGKNGNSSNMASEGEYVGSSSAGGGNLNEMESPPGTDDDDGFGGDNHIMIEGQML